MTRQIVKLQFFAVPVHGFAFVKYTIEWDRRWPQTGNIEAGRIGVDFGLIFEDPDLRSGVLVSADGVNEFRDPSNVVIVIMVDRDRI